VVEGARLESV